MMNDVRDHDHVDDHHDGGCHHFHNVIARSELIHEAQPYCDVTMEGGWGAANGWTSMRSLCPAVMPGTRIEYQTKGPT